MVARRTALACSPCSTMLLGPWLPSHAGIAKGDLLSALPFRGARLRPSPAGGDRQAEVLESARRTGSPRARNRSCTRRDGVGQHAAVELELRDHQVSVARLQHRPVHEPLVLRGETAAAPRPPVRIVGVLRVHQRRVEGEVAAVELGRVLAVRVAAELIAEKLIVAGDLPRLACSSGRSGSMTMRLRARNPPTTQGISAGHHLRTSWTSSGRELRACCHCASVSVCATWVMTSR